ncbi:hypothetical protein WR25_03311 [Diploscapter pachys]|uniref:ABC-type antigen peptide transporter n=1 Tax=Diploscapter pachys TaxID=2018661 RepID=A0A2A2L3K7_9BILA|nr:hypothetical protein WR25_03311 [Diploscapter pachys]
MRFYALLVFLYIAVDGLLTIGAFGYYQAKLEFDFDLVYNFVFCIDGYEFLRNPLDFAILFLIRVFFLTIAVTLVAIHKDEFVRDSFKVILGYAVFTYSYSLIKFLAFSENLETLKFAGVYMSLIWSIGSSVIFAVLWYFVLAANTLDYQQLLTVEVERTASQNSDSPRTVETNLEAENAEPTTPKQKILTTFQHIVRLLRYCSQQWRWFLPGFVFLIIYSTARVLMPNFMGVVIADIVGVKGIGALTRAVLIMSGLTMISTIFGGLRSGCFDYATALVSRQVRLELFNSLVQQEIGFFDQTKTGDLVSRLTADCATVSSTISNNLNTFLRNGVMLIGGVIFMFILSWRLAMVTFIAVPFIGLITKLYGAYYDRLSERMQNTIARANEVAEEVLSTMRTIRSFACEKREATRFNGLVNKTLDVSKKKAVAFMGYTWIKEFFDSVLLVGVLFYGGHLVMTGKMTVDELIRFLLYQMQMGENLYWLSYCVTNLMECVGASRKVFEYIHRKPTIQYEGKHRPEVNGCIEFNNVDFSYPSRPNNPVLKGLNLRISPGETVALVGPSGGGKTSVVSLIEHFYEPQRGQIMLDGIPVKDIAHVFYHQKIALVAQEPILYDGSVRYNILYGCDWATEDDMLEAAKTANVHDFVMEFEKGYDTNCGEKGVQMSGGQKQRISIARALVRNPAVLILDEATSALDAESEAIVQDAINRCAKERTVIIIAHRLSTIEKADRIAVIYKGSLIQTGSHSELMRDPEGLYYSLVHRQILSSKVGEAE